MTRKMSDNANDEWGEWQPMPGGWNPSALVLAETLDGGQAFRWREDRHGTWDGRWAECVIQLRLHAECFEWRTPRENELRASAALSHYFTLESDWKTLTDRLPWRSDAHLARCIEAFPGLRILRQPFGETLLGFLCSSAKQIVQIKQMLAVLAGRHGKALFKERAENSGYFHRLPTWAELAVIPEKELRACQFGFRARYVHETALFLARHPGWLEETERQPYAGAKVRLLELPGVGEKVADCVLLFGAGRLEAFPVDAWVLKSLARRYGLVGWKPAQVAQFGRVHFGPLAGLAQQYLFAWERNHGGR
jgi:N-glycosylase/DNA lyase